MRQQKAAQYAQRQADLAKERAEQRDLEARMAPVLARQQLDQARLQLEAQKAQAMQNYANAAQQNAYTNFSLYRLQSQQAGVPQIMTPYGFQPYAYGIANPYPYVQQGSPTPLIPPVQTNTFP